MGTFKALWHIYSMNTSDNNQNNVNNLWITLIKNKGYKMRKTLTNAKKVIEFRIKEEQARIKEARANMKKFDNGTNAYEEARIIFGASLQWESCLRTLLEQDLSDFNMKYFDELNEHKSKF
tara:strand:+ start:14845 stop:15207 length:363 start_codon:yes stop_codon:yes gene_type:complete